MSVPPHSGPTRGAGAWWVIALGAFVAGLGVVLGAGGAWLVALGGSPYYLAAGAGLLLAGGLMAARRRSGALLYAVVWLLTVAWALWEVGLEGWGLVPRLGAPTALLLLVLLSLPALRRRVVLLAAPILALGLTATPVPAAGPALPAATAHPSGAPSAAMRYSPLGEMTRRNARYITRAWAARIGDLADVAAPARTLVKFGDGLFTCTDDGGVVALQPGTGAEKWRHDLGMAEDALQGGVPCRGVATYRVPELAVGSACAERLILTTRDARLVAIDAETGAACVSFGDGGQVDIRQATGPTTPITSAAPTIVGRIVVVAGWASGGGAAGDEPTVVIRGYDAVTGRLAWTREAGAGRLAGASFGDEALGQVYLFLGDRALAGQATGGQTASALVALDVATGVPAWSLAAAGPLLAEMTLVDLPDGGVTRPALVLPSSDGELHVLDRRTGAAIVPGARAGASGSGVPVTPIPTFSGFDRVELTERTMWGLTPLDQLWCRIQFRRAESLREHRGDADSAHAALGRGLLGGVAVDPARGVLVVSLGDIPRPATPVTTGDHVAGRPYCRDRGARSVPEGSPARPRCDRPPSVDPRHRDRHWPELVAASVARRRRHRRPAGDRGRADFYRHGRGSEVARPRHGDRRDGLGCPSAVYWPSGADRLRGRWPSVCGDRARRALSTGGPTSGKSLSPTPSSGADCRRAGCRFHRIGRSSILRRFRRAGLTQALDIRVAPSNCPAAAAHPYRREIDGLRAVAVLPVMLFHAGFAAFAGGWLGVDVFFVISGYHHRDPGARPRARRLFARPVLRASRAAHPPGAGGGAPRLGAVRRRLDVAAGAARICRQLPRDRAVGLERHTSGPSSTISAPTPTTCRFYTPGASASRSSST